METETASDAKGNTEVSLQEMLPMKPGSKEPGLAEVALQPQPDDVATTSKTAVSPSTENRFPFLHLPPEIRNMVYRYDSTYTANAPWGASRFLIFLNLRQAPVTRVNRQLRSETLPLFYGNYRFVIHLLDKGHGPLRYAWDMLRAFTPVQNNTLQVNSLRFLSYLTLRLDVSSILAWSPVELGCHMSRKHLHCYDEGQNFMQTAGLDWNSPSTVREAYVLAIDSCEIGVDVDELLGSSLLSCDSAYMKANELACVMSRIARECPQLTTSVLAFVVLDDPMYDWLDEINGS